MSVCREISELRREMSARRPASEGDGRHEEGASAERYAEGPSGKPCRRQARRHRACEVERPLYDPGAKKKYRNEF